MTAASLRARAAVTSSLASPPSTTNSIVAPRMAAALLASAALCAGVPFVPDSPREQTTKCARRPARVSRAMTAPQPNSMSSGCAPKARSSGALGGDFAEGLIWALDGVAVDIGDPGRVLAAQVG